MKTVLYGICLLSVVNLSCSRGAGKREPAPVPVRVFVVHPDTLSRYLYLTGTLEAAREALVYARVSERLKEIRVKLGQRVRAGELLGRQEGGVFWQGVQQARAALQAAETQFQLAEEEYRRSQRLFKQGALTRRQYDESSAHYQQARAAWQQAQAALHQAEEQFRNTELRAPIGGVVASIYFELNDLVPAGQPVFRLVNPGLMKAWL
ncbi:MAG: efflux RND transporter periplasmic adaptor subunit, partial [Calditrichaeota bacterium]